MITTASFMRIKSFIWLMTFLKWLSTKYREWMINCKPLSTWFISSSTISGFREIWCTTIRETRHSFVAIYEYLDIEADYLIKKQKNNLSFAVKSEDFSQLKPLVEQFNLPPKISSCITDRVKAKSYKLVSFTGRGKIEKKGFKPLPDTIKAEALLSDVVIDFKEGVDVVEAEQMKLVFKNGNLYFDPVHPHYEECSLEGTTASIVGLFSSKKSSAQAGFKAQYSI